MFLLNDYVNFIPLKQTYCASIEGERSCDLENLSLPTNTIISKYASKYA